MKRSGMLVGTFKLGDQTGRGSNSIPLLKDTTSNSKGAFTSTPDSRDWQKSSGNKS